MPRFSSLIPLYLRAVTFNPQCSLMFISGPAGRVQLHHARACGRGRTGEYPHQHGGMQKQPLLSRVSSFPSQPATLVYVSSQRTLIKSPPPVSLPLLHLPASVFITLNCAVSSGAALTLITFAFQGAPGTQAYTWQPGPQVCSTQPASLA